MSGGAPDPLALIMINRALGIGHAVTPYAIEDRGGGVHLVRVYDNNFPDETSRYLVINTTSDTWSYEAATSIRAQRPATTWHRACVQVRRAAIRMGATGYRAMVAICPDIAYAALAARPGAPACQRFAGPTDRLRGEQFVNTSQERAQASLSAASEFQTNRSILCR